MNLDLDSRAAFIAKLFGPGNINQGSIAVNCPNCGKDNPDKKKLVIKLKDGMHHCWVCGLKGKTLKYTVKKFAPGSIEEHQRIFRYNEPSEPSIEESISLKLPKGFILLAKNLNSRDPDIKETISYAKSRGLSTDDFWYYKLGACKLGRYRRRLVIPSFDSLGKLNYFTGRAIDKTQKIKYLNAKAPKKTLIFNESNINWKEELTLVEGPMDLVKCDYNATALLGSSLNKNFELFKKIVSNSTPLVMAIDPDASEKMLKMCKVFYSYGINIRSLEFDHFSDVGEMSKLEFSKRKSEAVAWQPEDGLIYRINKIKSGSLI